MSAKPKTPDERRAERDAAMATLRLAADALVRAILKRPTAKQVRYWSLVVQEAAVGALIDGLTKPRE